MNKLVEILHLTPKDLLAEGFHRCLNQDALTHAPKIYLVHNNGFAGDIPLPLAFANPCLVDLAPAFRLRGARVEANDLPNILKRAEEVCASGHGPFFIELLEEAPTHE